MKNNTGIYQIVNLLNNKKYIGSSINLKKRKTNHFNNLKNKKHLNRHLQAAYNKYGKENFSFEILLYCKKEDLIFYEQRMIDSYDLKKELYNSSPTAKSALGSKHSLKANKEKSIRQKGHIVSEETKEKLRKANMGKKLSAEHIKKLSESHKNPSEEIRKKISEASKKRTYSKKTIEKRAQKIRGRKLSEETKKKLSESKMGNKNHMFGRFKELNHFFGKKHSEETRKKISEKMKGKNHHFYGKHFTEEHKKNISKANKGKKMNEITRKKMSESRTINFTEKEIEKIIKMRKDGKTYKNIENYFNCSNTPIIRLRKLYNF